MSLHSHDINAAPSGDLVEDFFVGFVTFPEDLGAEGFRKPKSAGKLTGHADGDFFAAFVDMACHIMGIFAVLHPACLVITPDGL